jgi:pyruvate dehydrogenase E1 component alpha subunit
VVRAAAYGVEGTTVDGNDVEAVFAASYEARARALDGGGATLIEAVTMRMHGHAAHDDMRYVPAELIAHWSERDPVERQQQRLAEGGVEVEEICARVAQELDAALAWALEQPLPDPHSATEGVFCEGDAEPLEDGCAPFSGYAHAESSHA